MSENTPQNESDFTPPTYRLSVDGKPYDFTNPEPTTRDILDRIGKDSTLFGLLLTSPTEGVRALSLDEETDLRRPGIEKFSLVSTRRMFHIRVDETPVDFDKHDPNGEEILGRVGKNSSRYALANVAIRPDNQFIDADEKVDLRTPGVEKFTTILWDEVRKDVTIYVNTIARTVKGPTVSYEQIINFAYDNNPPTGPSVRITVTYSRGHDDQPKGSLTVGTSVKVKEGMRFDVTGTNQS